MATIEQIQDALKDRNVMEVARQTGLTRYHIDRLKTGDKDVKFSIVATLAKYLGIE